ncbi:hypothetical protein [Mariniflexile maritimum]|uniref:hypothetical protein n=1 Tax=Mariniflexile maritimum TaxID=2682493 RepID=UPI0012F62CAB|nr:hypothetical protein [Mariniflexile maritimum]
MNFKALKKYKESGTVFLSKGDNLRAETKSIPNKPGIYLFYEINKNNDVLKYIGASGTMLQNGKFRGQMMRNRINNKMNSSHTRAQFFEKYFKKSNCDLIRIDWFATHNDEFLDLPKYVEANMLQEFYSAFGNLPEWNNSF